MEIQGFVCCIDFREAVQHGLLWEVYNILIFCFFFGGVGYSLWTTMCCLEHVPLDVEQCCSCCTFLFVCVLFT